MCFLCKKLKTFFNREFLKYLNAENPYKQSKFFAHPEVSGELPQK